LILETERKEAGMIVGASKMLLPADRLEVGFENRGAELMVWICERSWNAQLASDALVHEGYEVSLGKYISNNY